ncbi:conidial pigment polyketide synthase PksP/Alb1 [Anopheles sinensis]|uniref:Conidial pigment polyketide synthase PksP/Alb1 n=1 Tax=Anopheles sinensis TaxID=74873 RepID=A0A084VT10_ANOSI|nr:conidial pigment polyketide synthase PksP/Alb1 [Anopheles sinensis]
MGSVPNTRTKANESQPPGHPPGTLLEALRLYHVIFHGTSGCSELAVVRKAGKIGDKSCARKRRLQRRQTIIKGFRWERVADGMGSLLKGKRLPSHGVFPTSNATGSYLISTGTSSKQRHPSKTNGCRAFASRKQYFKIPRD